MMTGKCVCRGFTQNAPCFRTNSQKKQQQQQQRNVYSSSSTLQNFCLFTYTYSIFPAWAADCFLCANRRVPSAQNTPRPTSQGQTCQLCDSNFDSLTASMKDGRAFRKKESGASNCGVAEQATTSEHHQPHPYTKEVHTLPPGTAYLFGSCRHEKPSRTFQSLLA